MRLILLQTHDINLIARASTGISDHDYMLPSCVPDLRKPIMGNGGNYYDGQYVASAFAGGGTKAFIDFEDEGKVFIIKGVQLDINGEWVEFGVDSQGKTEFLRIL
ncbi:hypothetical protein IQ06DRAFT_311426 [Phaeosphaeriaceae sp. SRC1lsM3a]|nr:hypothetical protein IQ06DRAFT_311426 [Stagonospora sp. SRC1lsM3a]